MANLTPRKQRRLFREALEYFEGRGIDWALYDEPKVEPCHGSARATATWPSAGAYYHRPGASQDDPVIEIIWTHKTEPDLQIVLTQVWWHKQTGAILQAGSNYGRLAI